MPVALRRAAPAPVVPMQPPAAGPRGRRPFGLLRLGPVSRSAVCGSSSVPDRGLCAASRRCSAHSPKVHPHGSRQPSPSLVHPAFPCCHGAAAHPGSPSPAQRVAAAGPRGSPGRWFMCSWHGACAGAAAGLCRVTLGEHSRCEGFGLRAQAGVHRLACPVPQQAWRCFVTTGHCAQSLRH